MKVFNKTRQALSRTLAKSLIVLIAYITPIYADATDAIWTPTSDTTWQYQLEDIIDTQVDVEVFNINLNNSKAMVSALKAKGKKVICYFSVATNETFREDSALFPDSIQGETYEGWSDEAWLDITQLEILKPIMLARIEACQAKGFDGVEFDDIDIYNYQTLENGEVIRTGTNFGIQPEDSIRYFRWLASEAHARGLAVGLKNSPEILEDVIDLIDFMVIDGCYAGAWCHKAALPISMNKPVFMVDYTDSNLNFEQMCHVAALYGYSAIFRDRSLNAETVSLCPLVKKTLALPYRDIVIDGLAEDWEGIEISHIDPSGDAIIAGVDYNSIKVSQDQDNIYLLVSFEAATDWMTDPANTILIDTDNKLSTGYQLAFIGSELQIKMAGAFSQKNGELDEGEMENGTLVVAPSIDRKHWELAIPKSLTHPDGSSWLTSPMINIVLASYDSNGNALEFSPNNAWIRFVLEDIPKPQRFTPDAPISQTQSSASAKDSGGGSTNVLLLIIAMSLLMLLGVKRLKS